MIEELIQENNKLFADYYIFAICMWKDMLCIVPCDDEMSGYYPVYDKAVNISNMEIINFPNIIEGQKIDAIIVDIDKNSMTIDFATNSHDGFQPLGELI